MRKTIVMAGVLALSASMAHAQGRDRDDDEDGWRDRGSTAPSVAATTTRSFRGSVRQRTWIRWWYSDC